MVTKPQKETEFSKFVNKIIYLIAFVGPAITLPQLIQIWTTKNASGVSIITWIGLVIYDLFWIVYGIIHKDKPLLLTKCLFITIEIPVIIGIIMYG